MSIRRIPTTRQARRIALALVVAAATATATAVAGGPAGADPSPGASVATGPITLDLGATDSSFHTALTGGRISLTDGPAAASSVGVPLRQGTTVLRPVRLDAAGAAVRVGYDALAPAHTTAGVEVRAQRESGRWSEWVPTESGATVAFGAATQVVQVRVTLTAGAGAAMPSVGELTVAPASAPSASVASVIEPMAAPLISQVYATREGLVGGTTANGHVIVERDHFVALPSRRGLAAAGSGEYTVKVCAENGRCEWAPVWDVGPWNTHDDYWNPSDVRETWQDLPQGLPEAQAAYEDGYNGGQDEFGRAVANPAGIDLADGVFWDGLQLTDNSWVTATYLWTTDDRNFGTVDTDGGPLNVRSGASTADAAVGLAGDTAQVAAWCQVEGESITGTQGTTTTWYRIHDNMYVAAAYVAGVAATPPAC